MLIGITATARTRGGHAHEWRGLHAERAVARGTLDAHTTMVRQQGANGPMRDRPAISDERLRTCAREKFGLGSVALEFLPLGQDSRAGVYRAVDERGGAYLLKVKRGAFYEASCLVPRYLRDEGLEAVVAPKRTWGGALWIQVDDWFVSIYPFVVGESGWATAMTDGQWRSVGATLRQIHRLALPAALAGSVRVERFDPGAYSRWVHTFEARDLVRAGADPEARALMAAWRGHQSTIHTTLAALESLASALRGRAGPLVICHADLHPSNLIRDAADHAYLIDWDDVRLAPKERDFLFIEGTPAWGAANQDTSPLFQGYRYDDAPVAIDWAALTYFLWERVIQDAIAYAEEACLRDDLSAQTRAECVRMFERGLDEGGYADAARAAAAHLPAHLTPAP